VPILRAAPRAVTSEELAYIRYVLGAHPGWGRQALAVHLCQVWDWRRPDGTLNHRAGRNLLQRLAAQGLLPRLPPPRPPRRPRGPPPPAALSPAPAAGRGDCPLAALVVRPVRPSERPRWRALLTRHHYLGFQNTVGEALGYVATLGAEWVALLAWAAAAFKCGPRDAWIGWDEALKARRLHLVANNVRFLILPGIRIPNLASKVLARTCRRLSADWLRRYGHPVLLAETFVDPARFRGTCYRAAGWVPLGPTRGFGRTRGGYVAHGRPKLVFVRPLRPDAARLLAAPCTPPRAPGKEMPPMLDVNRLPLDGAGGLLEVLRTVTDPRKPRGVRHPVVAIVALAVCACLTGARSCEAIAQWARELSRDALWRLGCRRPQPPSEPTFRRVLQRLDADALDAQVGAWLARQTPLAGKAVALDGKTLRGAHDGAAPAPQLLSAVLHGEGLVLAQQAVPADSNEIPCVPPLLAALPLAGAVVTADALHTQVATTRYLVEEKKADYVFTAKDNQPTLKADIAALGLDAFPPAAQRDHEGARADRDPQHLDQP
jgi:hypothetical protein